MQLWRKIYRRSPLVLQRYSHFFHRIKNLYSYDSMQDLVLVNNKEILVGGRPVFIKEWFDSNILTIRDLLNSNGHLLSFQEFNPLTPVPPVTARDEPWPFFHFWCHHLWPKLASSILNFCRRKRSFQWCLVHSDWLIGTSNMHKNAQKVERKTQRQTSCHYTLLLHGKNWPPRWLFLKDSIDHTFLNCRFVEIFINNVIDWFNTANNSKFAPTIEEKLFGITSGPYKKEILKKFSYTILFMKYYIYTSKMHNEAIHLSVFVDKVLSKFRIESFSQQLGN